MTTRRLTHIQLCSRFFVISGIVAGLVFLLTAKTPATSSPVIERIIEVTVDRIVEVPVEKVVEVDKFIFVEVPPVEKVIYKTADDNWTITELVTFAQNSETRKRTWVYEVQDCDDFAGQLRDEALLIGKYLSIVTVDRNIYYRIFGTSFDTFYDYHVMNMARVGNQYYYVEPQNGMVVLAWDKIDA